MRTLKVLVGAGGRKIDEWVASNLENAAIRYELRHIKFILDRGPMKKLDVTATWSETFQEEFFIKPPSPEIK